MRRRRPRRRLAAELTAVYQERVTLVVPALRTGPGGRAQRTSALFGRVQAAMNRAADAGTPRVVEAPVLDEDALAEAGIREAAALALVHDDDETNIHTALAARRLNPRLRLVIRLYNRKLGQHLEELLDQAAALAVPGLDPEVLDTSTTVLSDATRRRPPWRPPRSRAPARWSRPTDCCSARWSALRRATARSPTPACAHSPC